MKITINSNDTFFHIDTYSVFTQENDVNYEMELPENENLTADDFDITYDNDGYRQALATASIDYIKELTADDGIVTDVVYSNSTSPQFYNYTTDSYTAEWTYNKNKLKKYINDHYNEWVKYTQNEWSTVSSNVNYHTKKYINNSYYSNGEMLPGKHTSIFTNNDCIASMLDFYTRELYIQQPNGLCGGYINDESYLYYMFDAVQGYEYIDINKISNADKRLEYLRQQIINECISYSEIAELQGLAEYIKDGDVLLLEWTGIPE